MRGVEGPPRANRAKRANPAAPKEPAPLYHGASHSPESNLGMRPSEGSGGAKRANRGTWNSTFSTGDSLAP